MPDVLDEFSDEDSRLFSDSICTLIDIIGENVFFPAPGFSPLIQAVISYGEYQ